ncbi:MAG: hypothetical protein QOJ21_1989 [Solirubrobacteraceae bacterium]|nr:hypothetical protein [Solirubrobacteraceae bacterium]
MTAAVVLLAGGLGPPAPALAVAAAAAASGGAAVEARGSWRWPVRDGAIIAGFRYAAARPFTAGARRGVDIVAPEGAAVRAACAGRVTFAGPVPGGALAVSVRCGRFSATHIGLGRLVVAEGGRVRAGGMLGPLGPSGRLRLGARIAGQRFGYVDPATLMGAGPGGAPAAPGPALGRAPFRPAPAPRAPPVAAPGPAPAGIDAPPAPAPVPAPAPAIPPVAWAGLVLLAAGVPLGGVVTGVRRRRRAPRAAPAGAPLARGIG